MSEETPALNPDPKPKKQRRLPRTAFKAGQSGNPGGAAKGTRISTWMIRLGQLSDAEIARVDVKGLPQFGQIALSRIRDARGIGGDKSTEIILERTEGKVVQPIEGEIKETKRIILVFPEGCK